MPKRMNSPVEAKTLEKLKERPQRRCQDRHLEPIGEPIAKGVYLPELLRADVLVDSSPTSARGFKVFRAYGHEIPQTILELGRLREETFRAVGEGSGLARDIDRFDPYYDHLIAFDKSRQEITGAYRLGRIDNILAEKGVPGIYTNTLFNIENLLMTEFNTGTLEAGRSFVRAEFQRGPTLLMIWSAISAFLSENPKYKCLIGAVSISDEFQENSKRLMVSYLMKHHPHEMSKQVTSKNPPTFDSNLSPEEITSLVDASLDLKELQEFVRYAEGNPKAQIPQLIKLYIDLGFGFLAFNKDDDFNSIDGLIWLDVSKIPTPVISRYMGEERWAKYSAYHQAKTPPSDSN